MSALTCSLAQLAGPAASYLFELTFHQIVAAALLPAMVSGIACFTITMLTAPYFIRMIHALKGGKRIREELAHHISKSGTPSMGGLLFTVPVVALTMVYNLVGKWSMLLPVVGLGLCSLLGWVDDRLTTIRIGGEGLRARFKFTWLVLIAIAIVAILHIPRILAPSAQNQVYIPTHGPISIGLLYWPLAVLAIVGSANAVNLTDGLDGLAAGTGAIAFATFGAIALLSQKGYLGEFCFTLVGALLAFLWFNVFPARIIMGDTGSLALGATLATVALMLNQALVLPVIGFVFVMETLSVVVQVGYFKMSHGKRIFRMAPLHGHLELLGWHENEVTQRFWIVSMLAAVAGLALAFI
jgi:phospho-N-acetylmuramoyl-pentapeptide-transferase